MKFYIKDTTLKQPKEKIFGSYTDVVNYLDGMSQRAYGQNRKERNVLLQSIGYGEDDRNATLFVRSMQEKFDIGVIRENYHVQCDITTIVAFQHPEYGD